MIYKEKAMLWPIRGIMLDPARQTESYQYYTSLIPLLAKWGYNTILVHLLDDEGCAVHMESVKVLPTSGAFSLEEWDNLVKLSERNGINMIPEIECLGHTGYITRLPENAELREPPLKGGRYWSICPLHPKTMEIMKKVIDVITTIFPSPIVHIGMDEADIGGGVLTGQALKTTPVWKLFGSHVIRMHELLGHYGKRCMLWGDHLLKHEELLEMLPRDILICNWLYGKGHYEAYESTTKRFLNAGYEVVGCPAGCWNGTILFPHADNIDNITEFNTACHSISNPAMQGMIATFWSSFRHLPATTFPLMAYAGNLFRGSRTDFTDVLLRFLEERYGLEEDALHKAFSAIAKLHLQRRWTLMEFFLMRKNAAELSPRNMDIKKTCRLAEEANADLESAVPFVRKNADEFGQWVSSVRFLGDLASIRLDEVVSKKLDVAAKEVLHQQFRARCLEFRRYAGTEEEEPAMRQIKLFGENSDNPSEM
jgi:glycosyl hydrolase family 20